MATSLPKEDIARIEKDVSRLNSVQDGLGVDAAQYIIHGDKDSVLLALKNAGRGANQALTMHHYSGASQPKPDLSAIAARYLYLHKGSFVPEVWARYGEVLVAPDPNSYELTSNAPGTANAPAALRLIVFHWMQGGNSHETAIRKAVKDGKPLTVAMLRAVASAAGGTDVDAADVLLATPRYSYYGTNQFQEVKKGKDFAAFLAEVPDAVMAACNRMDARQRCEVVELFAKLGLLENETYAHFALEQAFGSAKQPRETAQSQLLHLPKAKLTEHCQRYLANGSPSQRAEVVSFMARTLGEDARAILTAHKDTEKGGRVADAIAAAFAALDASQGGDRADDGKGYVALGGVYVEIPEMPPLPEPQPLADNTEALLKQAIALYTEAVSAHHEKHGKERYYHQPPAFKESDAGGMAAWLREGKSSKSGDLSSPDNALYKIAAFDPKGAGAIIRRIMTDAGLATQCRIFAMFREGGMVPLLGLLQANNYWSALSTPQLMDWLGKGGDFRVVARLIEAYGGPKAVASVNAFVGMDWWSADLDVLPQEALWPYFAENLEAFDRALGLLPWVREARHNKPSLSRTLEALQLLPKTPQRYLAPLLQLAASGGIRYRQTARDLLKDAPAIDDHIIKLLGDKKQEVRSGAAEWAAQRGMTAAIKPLHAALKKESAERPRAAFISALRDLGEDIGAYISERKLKEEAEAGLKKASFKDLEWFPFTALPVIRFKSGKAVPPEVLKWWIASANKLKQPAGNGLFELYLDQLAEADAAKLGLFLIDAFTTEDTRTCSEAEANAYAEAQADQYYQGSIRWDKTMTREKAFITLKQQKHGEYLSTAAGNSGILGLASRAPGAQASARVRGYFKAHGQRVSQSKALLQMLSANTAPAAIQLILAVSDRHKQKTVMALAKELIGQIAEDRGWTPDQLADRTTPRCGLDENGVLELPYGGPEKVYTARFDGVDKLILAGPNGKAVKSLPSVKSEDPAVMEEVKASKAALSGARTELKQVVSLQRVRLYEAMCAGRKWEAAEWDEHIRSHPVVGRFAQSVIWQTRDGDGKAIATFRPMEDGTLTDVADETVSLDGVHSVELAHSATMSKADRDAWAQHLEDYEIKPLFDQLHRPLIKLGDKEAEETEIRDREGWLMDFLAMRGRAAKLGYDNGAPEDAGFYYTWEKSFPSCGLIAIIEFTGAVAGYAEGNLRAAVRHLRFSKGKNGRAVQLSQVPPVLVSECWSDYRQIADGGAFDAEWEKKASW